MERKKHRKRDKGEGKEAGKSRQHEGKITRKRKRKGK